MDIGDMPLEPLPGLGRHLGLHDGDLLVLREDLIGLAGGGNKVRKAVAALGAAASDGVKTVITTGAPQSNHARATAIVGARLGLRVVLVLEAARPDALDGNLVLEHLAGAELHWADGRDVTGVVDDLAARAEGPVRVVPFGGTDVEAVEVYAAVGESIRRRVPDVRHAVVAIGSGATSAGLIAALGPDRVLGVDSGAVEDARGTLLGLLRDSRPLHDWSGASLRVDATQVGDGYATLPPQVRAAVETVIRTDGILFDVTYAGRALSGLVSACDAGEIRPGERTVLVHTGGVPGSLAHPALRSITPRGHDR